LDYEDKVLNARIQWAPAQATAIFDRGFLRADIQASMPWFSVQHEDSWLLKAEDLTYQGTQQRNAHGLNLGSGSLKIAQIQFGDPRSDSQVTVSDQQVKLDIAQRGQMIDVGYALSTRSIKWKSDELGAIHVDFRLNNLSEKAMLKLQKDMEKQSVSHELLQTQNEHAMTLFKNGALQLLTPAGSLELRVASVVYHSFKAGLRGKLWLQGIRQIDMLSIDKLKNALAAHFDLEVPQGLAEEIARLFARHMLEQTAEKGAAVTEDAVNQTAHLLLVQSVERLQSQKLIRVDHDMLRSSLDFSAGKLTVNGTPLNIPKLGG
jgi:uncharacterized protein YdgA (DUF945 family)